VSLPAGSRRALLLTLVFAGLTAGCAKKDGAVLIDGDPVLNRDTTWMAVGIKFEHTRPLRLRELLTGRRYIERGYEIQTYDLAHRKGPWRIVRWQINETEHPRVVGWDDSGIVVARGLEDAMLPVRVDPITGASKPIGNVPGRSLKAWSKALNDHGSGWDRMRRTHVVRRAEGYFLWNPRSRHEEFLFGLPAEHEGYLDLTSGRWDIERQRDAGTIHGVWAVSTRPEADSTRFVVTTYVPRPGSDSRLYAFWVRVELPDTTGETEKIFADRTIPLGRRELRLGPTATTLQLAISNRRLRDLIEPYRRPEQMRPPAWWAPVTVELHRVPTHEDSTRFQPVIPEEIAGDTETGVNIPIP
jgi:hypothetical protein